MTLDPWLGLARLTSEREAQLSNSHCRSGTSDNADCLSDGVEVQVVRALSGRPRESITKGAVGVGCIEAEMENGSLHTARRSWASDLIYVPGDA